MAVVTMAIVTMTITLSSIFIVVGIVIFITRRQVLNRKGSEVLLLERIRKERGN